MCRIYTVNFIQQLIAWPYRRLLYVACTRAQSLLYLTHTESRMMSGEYKPQTISSFVGAVRTDPKVCLDDPCSGVLSLIS